MRNMMISEQDILKQAEEAEKELEKEEVASRKSPLWLMMALGLALLIVAMIIPAQYLGVNKNPTDIPTVADIAGLLPDINNSYCYQENNFLRCLNPNDPTIKQVANKVVSTSCDSNKVCQAKALFFFVRDGIIYVSDPPREYFESPIETLTTGAADCDGQAILLANLLSSVGHTTRFVLIPGHSYVQMLLPEAPRHYKDSGNWINLDPTCSYCDFGEVPRGNKALEKTYVG